MRKRQALQLAMLAAVLLAFALAACTSTEVGHSEMARLIPQILGILILAGVVLLFV